MSDVEKDAPSFEDTGDIPNIPPKDDVKTSKIIADETGKIQGERIREAVRTDAGEPKKEPVGTMTKDVPQVMFRLVAKIIDCKKFELDDSEAASMAANLNILIPLSGKLAALVIVLMILVNKVYICWDAVMAKFGKKSAEETEKRPDLPEPLS